eukprot:TRINITY_DN12778_c0_g1_i1.p1 TRINITY_DN12778_c0_g1~~TRINITY_DN12778_c0_g1_i1.p1  ORF type:complete len:275 (+),score=40.98 TRINITY_DN12778_c0_g1_i1:213-1037(+)
MASLDLESLKSYVNGPSSQRQSDGTVVLHISHSNLHQRFMEIRFDLHMTVERVKERIRTHTGTGVQSMTLELYDSCNRLVAVLGDESRPLGFYSPTDGGRLHVVDFDPASMSAGGWLENTSLVQKFELSEEEYAKREGTYRKFKENKLAQDPSWTLAKEMAARKGEAPSQSGEENSAAFLAELAQHMKAGDRCEVDPGGRRGQVAYVGAVGGLPAGVWVGVHYDEPVGKNDGKVNGKRYFDCPPSHGSFIRPDKLKVGDFPERDPFDEEEPDEI